MLNLIKPFIPQYSTGGTNMKINKYKRQRKPEALEI